MMFQTLLETSLFVIPVILLLAGCSNLLGKRYGVKWRYLLWLVVAVRLCVPVQLSLPESMRNLQLTLPSVQNQVLEMEEERQMTELVIPTPMETEHQVVYPEQPQIANLPAETAVKQERNPIDFFLTYLNIFWLAGVALFLSWQGLKYMGFRKMLKQNRRRILDAAVLDIYYQLCRETGIQKRPDLHFCGGLPSPLCVGFFKQEIYINSEDRAEKDLRMILRHELIHCRRRDVWYKGILLLARALHFFNPFIHWMAKLAEKDMELSCDAAVMENCTLEERQAYSMAILRTVREAKHGGMGLSTAFFGGKEELKMRFENIFDMTVKKRGIALFVAAVLVVCGGTAFVGCTAAEPQEETEETLTGVVYGDYTAELVHQLYEAKLDYIGNHVGVGKILGLLPMPDGVTGNDEGMELFASETPYGARRYLDWQSTSETAYKVNEESYEDGRWFLIHGMIFLALVDNADYLEYQFNIVEKNGTVVMTKILDREEARHYFGDKDLREFAADEETFRNFVAAINYYFYEDIDTAADIMTLMDLDEEAAQQRMAEFLEGFLPDQDTLEEWNEDDSLSVKMIVADNLADEIARQNLPSSNPYDYIDCLQFQELVQMGEPALRQFLSQFAVGYVGDDLQGQIRMLACQDILGWERADAERTPMEWYTSYTALDSTLCAPFAYDSMLYTQDMEKDYGMDEKAAEEWSIVAAGQDARLQAVYDAIDARYNNGIVPLGHQVTVYAPYIYKMKESGDYLKVYAWIRDGIFAMSRTQKGYALIEQGGSSGPCRLDFEKRGGKWVLIQWVEAKDGSYYVDSIKQMCSGENGIANAMLNEKGDSMQLWQNIIYYMKAHYGGMNIPVYFHSYMEEKDIQTVNKYIRAIPLYEVTEF